MKPKESWFRQLLSAIINFAFLRERKLDEYEAWQADLQEAEAHLAQQQEDNQRAVIADPLSDTFMHVKANAKARRSGPGHVGSALRVTASGQQAREDGVWRRGPKAGGMVEMSLRCASSDTTGAGGTSCSGICAS